MSASPRRAIVVIGGEDPADATLETASRFDEVFVVARAVPDPNGRWVVDEDRAYACARARLSRVIADLADRGVRALGMVGDENESAARNDARALFPAAQAIFG